jgi:hypothetical protein
MRRFASCFLALVLVSSTAILVAASRSNTEASATTSFLGFDANDYPGDDALPVLRKTFSFTSFWLGAAPGEKRTTWLGKRALLASRGFGFVVLYNGRESRKLKSLADARQKGGIDAQTAASLARQEGFPSGTVIFLDIEEGGRLPESYHEYVRAWFDELARLRFHAGAYCSAVPVGEGQGNTIITARDLQDHLDGRKLIFWIFNDVCPPSPGCVFANIPPPSQGGFPAEVWQYAQSPRRKERTANCAASYTADGNCYAPGDTAHKWFIDANVARTANPSAPRD